MTGSRVIKPKILNMANAPKRGGAVKRIGRGRCRGHKTGMNKTEQRYAAKLDDDIRAGRVLWWGFEPLKLRLAASTFYEPDFLVLTAGGELEIHEVKGHWEDDARVKIKVAAELFPFRFIAAQPKKSEWSIEVFGQD